MVITEHRKGYRFSGRTVENIKYLVEVGAVRNETEAIDLAIEHLATEYRTKDKTSTEPKKNHVSIEAGDGVEIR